jgi:hypothetical protein
MLGEETAFPGTATTASTFARSRSVPADVGHDLSDIEAIRRLPWPNCAASRTAISWLSA